MKKRLLSLFSGCGGMDLGFEGGFKVLDASITNPSWLSHKNNIGWSTLTNTIFTHVFANDIQKTAMIAWSNYFSKKGFDASIYKLSSIVDLVKEQKCNNKIIFPSDIDIVTGGFPCQDFSLSGKRLGFNSNKSHYGNVINNTQLNEENRGLLYYWMREVISLTRPKIFIAENVKGIVNLNNIKNIIQKDFSSVCDNGYFVIEPKILHSGKYGIPQKRERIFFIGLRKSALKPNILRILSNNKELEDINPYPPPTHSIEESSSDSAKLKPAITVGMTLNDLPEPGDSINDLSQAIYSKAKWMGKHCQGQNEVDWDGLGPTIRAEHHGNIEYRRLNKEHGGKLLYELEQGLKERRLTVRECARIQSFPDDYEFIINNIDTNKSISASSAYKLIGNAVPPLLAFHIAKSIESLWDELFLKGEL